MSATIQFLNHAAVTLSAGSASVACDPWFAEPAFNRGWDLLAPDAGLGLLAAESPHIWISHEHPDHFSPAFFRDTSPRDSTVLFQKTRDRRVVGWLQGKGFEVTELEPGAPFELGDGATLTIGTNGFYDSWSLFRGGGVAILNLNDCEFRDVASLRRLLARTGPIDVLLTQFSYAAWKGGRDKASLRRAAARQKLETLALQARVLKPRWVVPFASFVWFSHEENAHLNDGANPVSAVPAVLPEGCEAVVMQPRDLWTVGEAWDNGPALDFWRERVEATAAAPRHGLRERVEIKDLAEQAKGYQDRVFAVNARWAMRLASWAPGLGAFRAVRVRLTDLDTVVAFSFFDPLRDLGKDAAWDAEMASESLSFIFRTEFGFDTLTVNGRFEAGPEGFAKLTKTFALGSLNALGLSVGPRLLLRLDVLWRLIVRLGAVVGRLRGAGSDVPPLGGPVGKADRGG
jgi:hypothetical protein